MKNRRFLIFMCLLLTMLVLSWGVDQGWAQNANKPLKFKGEKATPAEKKAAAKRLKDLGLLPGVAGLAPQAAAAPLPGIDGPGGVPHYFGPYG
ncbi:MAG TPA: hypothetical protein VN260_01225, partial [Dissulfurispiraceae bacterium]|nr:hypothetical protein [Dissulfurispiraceae bacterium]